MPARFCREAGCGKPVPARKFYCEQHAAARFRAKETRHGEKRRGTASDITELVRMLRERRGDTINPIGDEPAERQRENAVLPESTVADDDFSGMAIGEDGEPVFDNTGVFRMGKARKPRKRRLAPTELTEDEKMILRAVAPSDSHSFDQGAAS